MVKDARDASIRRAGAFTEQLEAIMDDWDREVATLTDDEKDHVRTIDLDPRPVDQNGMRDRAQPDEDAVYALLPPLADDEEGTDGKHQEEA